MLNLQHCLTRISIHALREEGDPVFWYRPRSVLEFLSTPSARRATDAGQGNGRGGHISIHALREEGDALPSKKFTVSNNFYPRPPRGGRLVGSLSADDELLFLSTPSARRATCLSVQRLCVYVYFYPRPPRGGRPGHAGNQRRLLYFYPRPPRGGRHLMVAMRAKAERFLSTPSARRATQII